MLRDPSKSWIRTLRCIWCKCMWQKRNVTSRHVFTHRCSDTDGLLHTLYFLKVVLPTNFDIWFWEVLNDMFWWCLTFCVILGAEMNFHFIRFLWNELCVLYPREFDKGLQCIKHIEFYKYRMKWEFMSYSLYHMIIPKKIYISWNILIEKCILGKYSAKIALKCLALHDVIILLLMASLEKKRKTGVKSVM